MIINFKKISAIAGTGLMVGMTMGMAAAANYPAPFVSGGAANVAIVYGTGSGVSILDAVEAGSIQSNLQSFMGASTGTTGSVSGEAAALFTGGTRLYINDALNAVKTTITKSEMPNALKEETFSGNVDSKITQVIQIGPTPRIVFAKQPTSSTDPVFGINTSTTNTNPIFNLTATFSKAVNFSHADSEGQSLTLFGMPVTVGSATDTDTIVLLKSAEKLSLSSDAPTTDATIAGAVYTIELVSASDSAATVKVTNSAGTSESKEINEAASKKVNGITIAVTTADETNIKLSATVIAGADKITLQDGDSVLVGEGDTVVDGTTVEFGTGNPNNLTTLTIQFDAPSSDKDSVNVGTSYVDPVFGSIKLDFAGINIPEDSTAREEIKVTPNSDNRMNVAFTEHRGNTKTVQFAKNGTTFFELMNDDSQHNISVREMEVIKKGDYVVVGNENKGYLLKLDSVANSSTVGTDQDRARFVDVMSGDTLPDITWSAEGTGTLTVGGVSYSITMTGDSTVASTDAGTNVTINYPDSTGNNMVIFPTIQTSKGAKLAFYEPVVINTTSWDNNPAQTNVNLSGILFPDGDGYTTVTVVSTFEDHSLTNSSLNITVGGTLYMVNTSAGAGLESGPSFTASVGKLTYNFSGTGNANELKVRLRQPGGSDISAPALIVWEEKDDNSEYPAIVVTLENGLDADDGMGISDVEDTWANDSTEYTLESNNKLVKQVDLWGTIITVDKSDSDQHKATINYPDEQLYAQVYVAAADAIITAGTAGTSGTTQLGDVLVKDSEVSSVSTKNLVVVGGSCINSVAANLVDAGCGSGWTDATGVGSGQFLIQSFGDAYSTGNIALLVAGYEVSDTVNAAKYLRTQTVMTDAGKKYVGTSSTSAELQTTETTTNSSA